MKKIVFLVIILFFMMSIPFSMFSTTASLIQNKVYTENFDNDVNGQQAYEGTWFHTYSPNTAQVDNGFYVVKTHSGTNPVGFLNYTVGELEFISNLSVRNIKKSVKTANQKKIIKGKIIMYSTRDNPPSNNFVKKGCSTLLYCFRFNLIMFLVAINL